MGLKKLFSTKEKHKEKKSQRESTRSSMSIGRWTKKRPESFASHLSNPYEQDKIELPATPSPSDDDSLQCSTKHVQDIPPSIDRLEFLVETCQQKNELLKNRLQTHEDTEDEIRALFNDTRHMPLVSLFTMHLEQREKVEQDYRSEINRWSEHARQLEAERDRVAKNEQDLQNRLAILTELYEQSERENTRLEYEKIQAEKNADVCKRENESSKERLEAEYKALSKEKENSLNAMLQEREEALKAKYEERNHILITRYEAMIRERDEAVELKYMKIVQDKDDALETKYKTLFSEMEAEHKSFLKEKEDELEVEKKAFADLETQAANEKAAFQKLKDALTERERTSEMNRASDLEEIRELKDIIRSFEQKPGKLLTRTKSTQQEELMRMHTKAQLGLIEYLEGEDDVIQAMTRFKRQLETDLC
ncbi:unnamed protein product [Rhizopus stolonifer]